MDARDYLTDIKARLVASAVIASIRIVEEYVLPDRGYIRVRLELINTDFLEAADHVIAELVKGVRRAVAAERQRLAKTQPKVKRGRPSSRDKKARRLARKSKFIQGNISD